MCPVCLVCEVLRATCYVRVSAAGFSRTRRHMPIPFVVARCKCDDQVLHCEKSLRQSAFDACSCGDVFDSRSRRDAATQIEVQSRPTRHVPTARRARNPTHDSLRVHPGTTPKQTQANSGLHGHAYMSSVAGFGSPATGPPPPAIRTRVRSCSYDAMMHDGDSWPQVSGLKLQVSGETRRIYDFVRCPI